MIKSRLPVVSWYKVLPGAKEAEIARFEKANPEMLPSQELLKSDDHVEALFDCHLW